MADFDDLSDDELRLRLLRRGVSGPAADAAVAHRDEPEAVSFIDEVLAP